MRKVYSMFLLGLAPLFFGAPAVATQEAADDKIQTQSREVSLTDRVKSYYQYILKGDRLAALELVTPASKNQLFNTKYDGLVDVRVVSYEFDSAGDHATVNVIRVSKVINFGQALDLAFTDVWQRENGQWYLVLPQADEMDTPFGKIKFNMESKPGDADAEAMKRHVEETYKNVDPAQYIRALQKAARQQEAAQHKPDDKQQKSQPDSPSTPQEQKPKPQN